jgi:hypothetical protein
MMKIDCLIIKVIGMNAVELLDILPHISIINSVEEEDGDIL